MKMKGPTLFPQPPSSPGGVVVVDVDVDVDVAVAVVAADPANSYRDASSSSPARAKTTSAAASETATTTTTTQQASSSSSTTTTATTTTATTTTAITTTTVVSNRSKQRPFRSMANPNRWVTREIAALEFLQMGFPMAKEGAIVNEGWARQHKQSLEQRNQDQSQSLLFEQSKNLSFSYNNSINADSFRKDEDDEMPLISPALLPLERSKTTPTPVQQGRWWEKWIVGQHAGQQQQQQQQQQQSSKGGVDVSRDSQIEDLEEPDVPQQSSRPQSTSLQQQQQQQQPTLARAAAAATIYAPGRRLEGDAATKIQIPLANALQNNQEGQGAGGNNHQRNSDVVSMQLTKYQSIARMAISKEWELRVAHGIKQHNYRDQQPQHQHHRQQHHQNPAMLDGRMYMSAKESYPMMVFSLLRYEPKKEEALRRRQKLEERGGGGTQFFIMPSRDWRGISYRALLPLTTHKNNTNNNNNNRDGERNKTNTGTNDEREDTDSAIDKRRNTNNPRLLFDRFAAKKTDSKQSLMDGSENPIHDGIPSRDASTKDGSREDDEDSAMDSDDEDEEFGDDTYVAGLLDNPGMVQGRHRNVMIGDRGTGPIVSSTIQFVKPKLLKADLNKQFRERFDGYEPPISQHKFIGAKVVDGLYTLIDPTIQEKGVENDDDGSKKKDEDQDDATGANTVGTFGTPTTGATSTSGTTRRSLRKRQSSITSQSLPIVGGGGTGIDKGDTGGEGGTETIRMPPSLTLSKIRSLKQQALAAAVQAKLEISTVALAIIYFERLCLDCRVDKSNRRLSFAACLLLAIKINEAHCGVIAIKAVTNPTSSKKSRASQKIQSLIRSSKKSSTMFASLLEFFTQEWNISLKHLFAAEWGVFAALQFRLKAKPSDVAFHFRRLMKTLGYDPRRYLGSPMYGFWQRALAEEELRFQEWEARVESRRQRKEEMKLKQLQREIEDAANRRGEDGLRDGGLMGDNKNEDARTEIGEALDEQSDPTQPSSSYITWGRRGLTDIFKTRIAVGGGTMGGPSKQRSASTERSWTNRRGSGDAAQASDRFFPMRRGSGDAAQASDRFFPMRRGSGDAAKASIKSNNPISAVAAGTFRQLPQIRRPLSQSQSMLSLSGRGDEISNSRKSQIPLEDLDGGAGGRPRGRSVGDSWE